MYVYLTVLCLLTGWTVVGEDRTRCWERDQRESVWVRVDGRGQHIDGSLGSQTDT